MRGSQIGPRFRSHSPRVGGGWQRCRIVDAKLAGANPVKPAADSSLVERDVGIRLPICGNDGADGLTPRQYAEQHERTTTEEAVFV